MSSTGRPGLAARVLLGALVAGIGMAAAVVCGLWAQTLASCSDCSRPLFVFQFLVVLLVLPGGVALLVLAWTIGWGRTDRPGGFSAVVLGLGVLWVGGGCLALIAAALVGGWFHAVGALGALAWVVAVVFVLRRFDTAELAPRSLARLDL